MIDVDQDTYILAESAPTADEDTLTFFTGGTQQMIINDSGNVGIGTNVPSRQLTISKSSNTVEQLELQTTGGIADGQYTGIKFTQGTNGETSLGYIQCNFQTDGSTSCLLYTSPSPRD